MKKLLILTLLTLFLSISIFAQNNSSSKKHEFKGIIQTQDSEVISGANLYFKNGERKFTVYTDINGEFQTKLDAGDYEITVNDVLSKSFKAFIKIQDKDANPNDVVFTVKTNKNPCGLAEDEICPKPLKLPKPAFPTAARAAGTKGEVVVLIKIDSSGKVISAIAQDTHPLFKEVAEKAGRGSLFEPNENSEHREIKLTYVFFNYSANVNNETLRKYENDFRIGVEIAYEPIQF